MDDPAKKRGLVVRAVMRSMDCSLLSSKEDHNWLDADCRPPDAAINNLASALNTRTCLQ